MGRIALLAAVAAALAAAALAAGAWALVPPDAWAGWAPATCVATGCFCEAVGTGGVRQPLAAASSLAFVPVGAWSLALAAERRLDRGPGALLGVALVLTGLGSAWYHASLTFAGQFADVLGMHLAAFALLAHALADRVPSRVLWAGVAAGAVAVALVLWLVPDVRRWLFAVLLVGAVAAYAALRRTGRGFVVAVGLFAAAFGVWALDAAGVACDPTSALQGHAVWHVLGAVAAGVLVWSQRRE